MIDQMDKKYRDLVVFAKRETAGMGPDYSTFVRESRRADLEGPADLALPLQVSADADAVDLMTASTEGGEGSIADLLPSISAQLCAQYLCARSVTVERLLHVKKRLVYFNESDALYCISLLILLERKDELRLFCKYLDFVRKNELLGQDKDVSTDLLRFAYYLRECIEDGRIGVAPNLQESYGSLSDVVSRGQEALGEVLDKRLSMAHKLAKKGGATPFAFALAPVEVLALVKLMNAYSTGAKPIEVPSHASIPPLFMSKSSARRELPPEVSHFIESVKDDIDAFMDTLPT